MDSLQISIEPGGEPALWRVTLKRGARTITLDFIDTNPPSEAGILAATTRLIAAGLDQVDLLKQIVQPEV